MIATQLLVATDISAAVLSLYALANAIHIARRTGTFTAWSVILGALVLFSIHTLGWMLSPTPTPTALSTINRIVHFLLAASFAIGFALLNKVFTAVQTKHQLTEYGKKIRSTK